MNSEESVTLLREAIVRARAGRRTDARVLVQRVTEAQIDNEAAWFWLAYVAETVGESIVALRRVLEIAPANRHAQTQMGRSCLAEAATLRQAGKKEEGRQLLVEAAKLDGGNEAIWLALASCEETLRARAPYLRRALEINPENRDVRADLDKLASEDAREETSRSAVRTPVAPPPRSSSDSGPQLPIRPPVDGRRTILIVDDSPTVRKTLSLTLERNGYTTIAAANAMEALGKIDERVPDLILLDITMPHLDGYQLCKLIKGNTLTQQVPVVMLSGNDSPFDKVRGRMAGAVDYLTKPFEPKVLLQTIETHLRTLH